MKSFTRYGYDKAGRAVILIAANGQTSSNTYDVLGRLTDRVLYKSPAMDPAQRLAQFQWQHDLLGNVTQQEEIWPGEPGRAAGVRRTTMGYDANNRLTSETISHPTEGTQSTTYTYDNANNRTSKTVTGGAEPGHWDYTYNAANQLTAWEHLDYPNGSVLRSASLTYDDAGNRTSQTIQEQATPNQEPRTTAYTWDAQDRLASVTLPNGSVHRYAYDYRTRRISTGVRTPSSANETRTAIVFSGGLSLAEYDSTAPVHSSPSALSSTPTVDYTRGTDMGGGVGGLLYTSRSESASAARTLRYNLSNGRGDIVAQSDAYAALTWTASYEAYGKRTKETGENKDKQRGNSKDEDPTGLLNEGFRYRDIETGVWLSRDPAGFVDGPNLYAYVKQNPWTGWDPDGLATVIGNDDKTLAREPKKVKPSVYSKRVIFDHETGGEDNYNAELKKPTWPGGASGVTVGVGYDLGYNTKDQIQKDWGPLMPQGAVEKMQSVAGVKGEKAKGELSKTKGVIVPLETARNVFEQNSVPRFSDETQKTFPGTENLHPHSQGALVSLVFNRGGALKNVDSRKEMRQIRDALVEGKPEKVPQLIRNMKRLWEGKKLGGLLTRRDDEAKMFETGLMMDRLKDVPTGMPANPFNNP